MIIGGDGELTRGAVIFKDNGRSEYSHLTWCVTVLLPGENM